MRFENAKVVNFEGAFRGRRNPKESWNLSDSLPINANGTWLTDDEKKKEYFLQYGVNFNIGEKDLKLAQRLIKAGTEHRKFMRQIFVSVDITAPLYWWKEYDTYKVGTVANSTSTMHKCDSKPIDITFFETDDYHPEIIEELGYDVEKNIIGMLETLREEYKRTGDKKYWKELIRWMPNGWLQTRTCTFNYENLLGMCSKGQRRYHKLNCWSGIDDQELPNFISFARDLPYAQELIFIDELENKDSVAAGSSSLGTHKKKLVSEHKGIVTDYGTVGEYAHMSDSDGNPLYVGDVVEWIDGNYKGRDFGVKSRDKYFVMGFCSVYDNEFQDSSLVMKRVAKHSDLQIGDHDEDNIIKCV